MVSKYNHTTLVEFISSLKEASGDLLGIFWTDSEWKLIIQEALLTFGALNGFYKDEIFLNTIEDKRVYDIFTDITSVIKIAPTITYQKVIDWLNRDLIEEISIGSPISKFFSLTELLSLIEAQYNDYQLETNLIINQLELDVAAQNDSVKLPDNVIDIVRICFTHLDDNGDEQEIILQRCDEQEISYFDFPTFQGDELPIYFSTLYGSPNNIRLYPNPSISGKLKLLLVSGRDTTIALDVNTIINLPNNLVPYLRFGILYNIFNKDGLFNDQARAAYFLKRWQEGIVIGRNYTSILVAKANGEIITADSVNKLDDYVTPMKVDYPPTILGLAGFNIFETDIIPDSSNNSITLLCNLDMPLPQDDIDFIDVEKSYLEIIKNYCIHIAQTKCGAAELAITNSYMEDFIKLALQHNIRLIKRGITYVDLVGKTKQEEVQKPRMVEVNG